MWLSHSGSVVRSVVAVFILLVEGNAFVGRNHISQLNEVNPRTHSNKVPTQVHSAKKDELMDVDVLERSCSLHRTLINLRRELPLTPWVANGGNPNSYSACVSLRTERGEVLTQGRGAYKKLSKRITTAIKTSSAITKLAGRTFRAAATASAIPSLVPLGIESIDDAQLVECSLWLDAAALPNALLSESPSYDEAGSQTTVVLGVRWSVDLPGVDLGASRLRRRRDDDKVESSNSGGKSPVRISALSYFTLVATSIAEGMEGTDKKGKQAAGGARFLVAEHRLCNVTANGASLQGLNELVAAAVSTTTASSATNTAAAATDTSSKTRAPEGDVLSLFAGFQKAVEQSIDTAVALTVAASEAASAEEEGVENGSKCFPAPAPLGLFSDPSAPPPPPSTTPQRSTVSSSSSSSSASSSSPCAWKWPVPGTDEWATFEAYQRTLQDMDAYLPFMLQYPLSSAPATTTTTTTTTTPFQEAVAAVADSSGDGSAVGVSLGTRRDSSASDLAVAEGVTLIGMAAAATATKGKRQVLVSGASAYTALLQSLVELRTQARENRLRRGLPGLADGQDNKEGVSGMGDQDDGDDGNADNKSAKVAKEKNVKFGGGGVVDILGRTVILLDGVSSSSATRALFSQLSSFEVEVEWRYRASLQLPSPSEASSAFAQSPAVAALPEPLQRALTQTTAVAVTAAAAATAVGAQAAAAQSGKEGAGAVVGFAVSTPFEVKGSSRYRFELSETATKNDSEDSSSSSSSSGFSENAGGSLSSSRFEIVQHSISKLALNGVTLDAPTVLQRFVMQANKKTSSSSSPSPSGGGTVQALAELADWLFRAGTASPSGATASPKEVPAGATGRLPGTVFEQRTISRRKGAGASTPPSFVPRSSTSGKRAAAAANIPPDSPVAPSAAAAEAVAVLSVLEALHRDLPVLLVKPTLIEASTESNDLGGGGPLLRRDVELRGQLGERLTVGGKRGYVQFMRTLTSTAERFLATGALVPLKSSPTAQVSPPSQSSVNGGEDPNEDNKYDDEDDNDGIANKAWLLGAGKIPASAAAAADKAAREATTYSVEYTREGHILAKWRIDLAVNLPATATIGTIGSGAGATAPQLFSTPPFRPPTALLQQLFPQLKAINGLTGGGSGGSSMPTKLPLCVEGESLFVLDASDVLLQKQPVRGDGESIDSNPFLVANRAVVREHRLLEVKLNGQPSLKQVVSWAQQAASSPSRGGGDGVTSSAVTTTAAQLIEFVVRVASSNINLN